MSKTQEAAGDVLISALTERREMIVQRLLAGASGADAMESLTELIDGLIIANFERPVFEDMRKGGLTAVNCTCSKWRARATVSRPTPQPKSMQR